MREQIQKRLTTKYLQARAPLWLGAFVGLTALAITAPLELARSVADSDSFLFWSPIEIAVSAAAGFLIMALANHRRVHTAKRQLAAASKTEDNRRAIAAIGMAASWDLDLDRLYNRVSQDLRSILAFDRFTITSALPTGQMKIEFVSGVPEEGLPTGAILPEVPEEPDGLYSEFTDKYRSRLTVAIAAKNGTLTIRHREEGYYTAEDLDLLRQAVAQISPGIANAVMFQASERRVRERTVLSDIGRAVTSTTDPQRILSSVDASLNKLITYDHLGVILVDETDEERKTGIVTHWSSSGLSGWKTGDRLPIEFASVSQGIVVSTKGPAFTQSSEVVKDEHQGDRSWLQAPLFVQEQLIGLLIVSSEEPDGLGQEDSAFLLNVSLQIAPAIENANLTARLQRQADERRAVAAIGLAANSDLNLDAIYAGLSNELANVLQFDRMSITSALPEDDKHEIVYTTGVQVEGFQVGDVIDLPNVTEASASPTPESWLKSAPGISELLQQTALKSKASAPLGTARNLLGHIYIASMEENAYTPQDVDLLQRIAIQVAPAIRNARMIAAERELRETLDRQNQELYEANNARKQFLSTVSHELKTPLTIIAGFIDLLSSDNEIESEEQRQETLSIVRRNADQLNVLINDILDISRLDAGTFKINPAPFRVADLISDLEASFQSLLRTKTQTMTVDMPDDEVWIDADRARISQVITNLLSNASKYSPDGTEITLGCRIDGERLKIMVKDQGHGISEEEQKGLFTAFFRADNEMTRKVSGTGLGLVIAKSITELHGGEIRLSSKPGAGTTIDLWLPKLASADEAAEESSEEVEFPGSRLWPDGPPDDIGIGAD